MATFYKSLGICYIHCWAGDVQAGQGDSWRVSECMVTCFSWFLYRWSFVKPGSASNLEAAEYQYFTWSEPIWPAQPSNCVPVNMYHNTPWLRPRFNLRFDHRSNLTDLQNPFFFIFAIFNLYFKIKLRIYISLYLTWLQ